MRNSVSISQDRPTPRSIRSIEEEIALCFVIQIQFKIYQAESLKYTSLGYMKKRTNTASLKMNLLQYLALVDCGEAGE